MTEKKKKKEKISTPKLEAMLADHKGRGGEREAVFAKLMKGMPVHTATMKDTNTGEESEVKLVTKDFLVEAITRALLFYRHVGAIWILESILEDKDAEWGSTKSTKPETEDGKPKQLPANSGGDNTDKGAPEKDGKASG